MAVRVRFLLVNDSEPISTLGLRSVETADIAFLLLWASDQEITRNTLGRKFPSQRKAIRKWIRISNSGEYPSRLAFTLVTKNDQPVGLVQLDQIDWVARNAWLGIWIIPEFRGRGFGKDAMQQLLTKASNEFNLRQIRLLVRSDNTSAVGLYERLGFKIEGELADCEYREGKYVNLQIFCRNLEAASHTSVS